MGTSAFSNNTHLVADTLKANKRSFWALSYQITEVTSGISLLRPLI